ncbi:MAG TPA: transposase, partial [Acetobacteraceae bacterium]|nr:transposase [Acetobacteraceae bacterium]
AIQRYACSNLLRTECQWRYLPKDFPPRSTIYNIFRQWQRDGDWDRIHHALLVKLREPMGREASQSADIIDSQSVKSAEKGGSSPRR